MNRPDHDEASLHVEADAGLLYDLVSDVTRTPEWSPEVISCEWLGGADRAAVGQVHRAQPAAVAHLVEPGPSSRPLAGGGSSR